MTRAFVLHAQLAADTFVVGDLPLSRVLLMNDARFPWVIVVPRRAGLTEFLDLDEDECGVLQAELRRVGAGITALFQPDKLNVAALGNRVPQLHVHVIGRFRNDPAWPNPVWGTTPAPPYGADAAVRRINELRGALRLRD
jgi:diadenosine tetraphosphate (Ap4A) HIT family hydrolase